MQREVAVAAFLRDYTTSHFAKVRLKLYMSQCCQALYLPGGAAAPAGLHLVTGHCSLDTGSLSPLTVLLRHLVI